MKTPDLTQGPPRSPRVRLGGYVILPRLLDKCRATLGGKHGEYNFNCPMDQRFFEFVGIGANALKAQVARGLGDGEILEWIKAQAAPRRSDAEIAAWSANQCERVPGGIKNRAFFHDLHARIAPKREDILTWFDLLDLDDYVSFGGQA
ncbi:MAG: DUF5069 domain-containing protein [Verrucomicrobia bacterium]|nr:DUF5069 domain-containing protein [Verrucomicrobiota bacterium]